MQRVVSFRGFLIMSSPLRQCVVFCRLEQTKIAKSTSDLDFGDGQSPVGVDVGVQRIINENGRVLKFKYADFESTD